ITRNYEQSTYKLTVNSSLMLLERYKVDYNTLHSTLVSGASLNEYNSNDNEGYPNVQILYLMKKMFSIAGLSLDTSNVDSRIVESGGVYGTIYENDLVLDENMLYALNQDYAMNYRVVEGQPSYAEDSYEEKKITFMDFFKRFCIGRGYYVHPGTSSGSFVLEYARTYSSSNNYSISDSRKYDYKVVQNSYYGSTDNYYEIKADSDAVGGAVTTVRGLYAGVSFAPADVYTGSNYIESNNHNLRTGSRIRFTSTGTLPGGISSANTYYVVNPATNTFQIANSKDGTAIPLTSIGSGTHYYYGEYDLKVSDRQGYGKFRVPYWNNFKIRYHQSGTSVGYVQSGAQLTSSLMDYG
ncbi:hypothetical protein D6827_01525, partial [Candidatus Parcubacteria bacterium]